MSEELNLPERARLRELERENRGLRVQAGVRQKSGGLLREGTTVRGKYALIDAEKAIGGTGFTVGLMRTALGVSRSGLPEWAAAAPRARARRRAKVGVHMRAALGAGRGPADGVRPGARDGVPLG